MSMFDIDLSSFLDEPQAAGGNDPEFPGVYTGGTDTSGMFPDLAGGNPYQDMLPGFTPGPADEPMPIDGRGYNREHAVSGETPGDFSELLHSNPFFVD